LRGGWRKRRGKNPIEKWRKEEHERNPFFV
jgi:hypothetical protein